MALIHPSSLELWQEWQESRHRLRNAKHTATDLLRVVRKGAQSGPEIPGLVLHSRAGEGDRRTLIGIDSASPTSRASLLSTLPYLNSGVDVLTVEGIDLPELDGPEWTRETVRSVGALNGRGIQAVTTLGQHLRVGRAVHEWARLNDVASAVVQHGALTPYAPPLPEGSTLLAWSRADGEFYRSGRDDLEIRAVGSQLLWQAGHEGRDSDTPLDTRPVFLGQMHGAELPRRITAGAAYRFCRDHGAIYRPHPSELDVLSRRTHGLFRRRGIEVQSAAAPLRDTTHPVVGVFSTGVLEAAVRGIPAWVYGPRAPRWVHEFWYRYGMRRFGGSEPTPPPETPADEPARLIAQALEGTA